MRASVHPDSDAVCSRNMDLGIQWWEESSSHEIFRGLSIVTSQKGVCYWVQGVIAKLLHTHHKSDGFLLSCLTVKLWHPLTDICSFSYLHSDRYWFCAMILRWTYHLHLNIRRRYGSVHPLSCFQWLHCGFVKNRCWSSLSFYCHSSNRVFLHRSMLSLNFRPVQNRSYISIEVNIHHYFLVRISFGVLTHQQPESMWKFRNNWHQIRLSLFLFWL